MSGLHSTDRFNLAISPWLPVHDLNGVRHLLSLEDLFRQAGTLADLDLRPHERVAVMRLLICITQAALGAPEDVEDWTAFGQDFEVITAGYLQRWQDGFELFGDGLRFLQLRPNKTGEPVPVSKLLPHLATGNNPTPFDQGGGTHRPLPLARLALALLTFQNFYPLYGAGYKGRGPCVDGNMIHTLVRGDNLRATILRNCLDLDTISRPQLGGMGRPIWEHFPASPADRPAVENATRTYLGRLVPLQRSVWRTDDRASFLLSQQGWEYPRFEVYREPTATIIANDKGEERLLWASLHRAVWRELHALTVRHVATADGKQAGGPLVLRTHRADGEPEDEELWTGALVTDLKAKILDTVESVFQVPARMFDPTGQADYGRGVEYARLRAKHLFTAVKAYGEAMKNRDNPPTDRASRHYWNDLDQQSTKLLELVRYPGAIETRFGGTSPDPWTRAVRTALQRAYDAVCPRLTPRQIEAYAEGLRALSPPPPKPKPIRRVPAKPAAAS